MAVIDSVTIHQRHIWQPLLSLAALLMVAACESDGNSGNDASMPPSPAIVDEPCTIVLTPNDNREAPLAAIARFTTAEERRIGIRVLADPSGEQEIEGEIDGFRTEHTIPIVGLYAGRSNRVEITMTARDGNAIRQRCEIQTEPILNNLMIPQEIEIVTDELPTDDDTLYLVLSRRPGRNSMVFDRHGRIRWYGLGIRVFSQTAKGALLGGISSIGETLAEFNWLGEIRQRYMRRDGTPIFLNHTAEPLTNGRVMGADDRAQRFNLFVTLDQNTGEEIAYYDLDDILDPNRWPPLVPADDRIYTINSLFYDEEDDGIVVSVKRQNAVVKIDASTMAIIWILGHHDGWVTPWSDSLLAPLNFSVDKWPYDQHSARILPNGNLLLFNNGVRRNRSIEGAAINSYNSVVEYAVDETAGTVSLVWEYRPEDPHSRSVLGSIRRLPNDNRLILFPLDGRLAGTIEVISPEKEVQFKATFPLSFDGYQVIPVSFYP